jgi:hypothetical protein
MLHFVLKSNAIPSSSIYELRGRQQKLYALLYQIQKNCPIWARNRGDIQIVFGCVTFELPGKMEILFDEANIDT